MKIDTANKAHELWEELQYLLTLKETIKNADSIKIYKTDSLYFMSLGKDNKCQKRFLSIMKQETENIINEVRGKINRL